METSTKTARRSTFRGTFSTKEGKTLLRIPRKSGKVSTLGTEKTDKTNKTNKREETKKTKKTERTERTEEKVEHPTCPICSKAFPLTELEQHAQDCLEAELQCPVCSLHFPSGALEFHVEECLSLEVWDPPAPIPAAVPEKVTTRTLLEECHMCSLFFETDELKVHLKSCSGNGGYGTTTQDGMNASATIVGADQEFHPCPLCPLFLAVAELESHVEECFRKSTDNDLISTTDPIVGNQCPLCGEYFPLEDLTFHVDNCISDDREQFNLEDLPPEYFCFVCNVEFPSPACLDEHIALCLQKRQEQEESDELMAIDLTRPMLVGEGGLLQQKQLQALQYVQAAAKKLSEQQKDVLKQRIQNLGYDDWHFKLVTEWIRNRAEIIIHVNLDIVLTSFVNDTDYRNRFEVMERARAGSSGSLTHRVNWERRMFAASYENATPSERVKYGVLNPTNNPEGVRSCYSYGDSFMTLRSHTRYRATFADMDTGSDAARLATCEHYNHILTSYNDGELKAVIQVAKDMSSSFTGARVHPHVPVFTQYKELQIHGSVNFARDVERLTVNPRFRATMQNPQAPFLKLLQQFQDNNPVMDIIWMDTGLSVWSDRA